MYIKISKSKILIPSLLLLFTIVKSSFATTQNQVPFETKLTKSPAFLNPKGKQVQPIDLLVNLEAIQLQNEDKKKGQFDSFDIAIILDNSGSMAGPPLEQSKRAIKEIAETLGPKDRLHLVTYSSDSRIIFSDGTQDHLKELKFKIDEIHPEGSTNMGSGLKLMDKILSDRKDGENSKRKTMVFLFSDGMVNVGMPNDEILKYVEEMATRLGIRFSSFGIGAHFDEKLMASIADYGKGDYLYINNQEVISKILRLAHDGTINLLATDLSLTIKNQHDMVSDIHIEGEERNSLTTHLRDVHLNSLKKVLITSFFLLNRDIPEEEKEIGLFDIVLDFTDQEGNRKQITIPFKMEFNSHEEEIQENPSVRQYKKLWQMADRDSHVLELLQSGHTEDAILEKQEIIQEIEELENEMPTEKGSLMLKRAKSDLKTMKNEQDRDMVVKAAHQSNRFNYKASHADNYYEAYN